MGRIGRSYPRYRQTPEPALAAPQRPPSVRRAASTRSALTPRLVVLALMLWPSL